MESQKLQTHYRTDTCGALRKTDDGKDVTLVGWVFRWRDHGGIVFIDLRDRFGVTQIVFDRKSSEQDIDALAHRLRSEFVIQVKGLVRPRPEGAVNESLLTGEIEISATHLEILSKSDNPPFRLDDKTEVGEDIRLQYRYLDLRREELQRYIRIRNDAVIAARKYMDTMGFLDIETPILCKPTPEGARDFLVPARMHPGKFYALPQSPQIYKQILMVSGFDRYYQIARCFRDEALRADRQLEFTQIDVEMSFINEDDIIAVIEGLMEAIYRETLGIELKLPFARMSYDECMERYGIDRPDLRYELEIRDLSEAFGGCEFRVFNQILDTGGRIRGIVVPAAAGYSRKELDDINAVAMDMGSKGCVWQRVGEAGEHDSSIKNIVSQPYFDKAAKLAGASKGDLLVFVGGPDSLTSKVLARLRQYLAAREELIDKAELSFLWVTDFPLFEQDEATGALSPAHHPFTSPRAEDLDKLESEPEKVRSRAYDIVLNGSEIGGGSIRIHSQDLQRRIFRALGISDEDAEYKFGFLLKAFQYGPPPHGGIAMGMDRIAMLLSGTESIRDVIAFPKSSKATGLMEDAPAMVDEKELLELHIRKIVKKKDAT
ncbi:MAG: aspartate--tRNA ligase [Candidatus Glassbacteria bacterium]|nr:aspartate--tRNA ligase [Candidatus Glassbacteria bacterium]